MLPMLLLLLLLLLLPFLLLQPLLPRLMLYPKSFADAPQISHSKRSTAETPPALTIFAEADGSPKPEAHHVRSPALPSWPPALLPTPPPCRHR